MRLKTGRHPACIISILIPLLIRRLYLGPERVRGSDTAPLSSATHLSLSRRREVREGKKKKINRRGNKKHISDT